MEENKVRALVMAVLAGVFAGICLLFGMLVAVETAVRPVREDVRELLTAQIRLEQKMDLTLAAGQEILLNKVGAIESQLAELKGGKGQPAAPQLPPEPKEDFNKVYDIPIGGSAVFGKADAPLTIVEFTDMQCPYCARFHPAVKEVMKAYPDQVKLVLKHYPLSFHAMARPAAKAALAADVQGKFYEMVDLIMANAANLSEDKFKEFAAKLGLKVEQFEKDRKERDAEWEKKIEADIQLGTAVDVLGTPTYYLNGRKTKARTPEAWKKEIDALLGAGAKK